MRLQLLGVRKQKWYLVLLVWYLLGIKTCQSFSLDPKAKARLDTQLQANPVVAVVGGDLSGVVAASKLSAEAPSAQVVLLTGLSKILEGFPDSSPILPDLALENRELIDHYGNGGRELAGILAKQCTPRQAKEWLEEQGILLRQDETTTMTTLLNEKPLCLSPKSDLQQVMQDNLERAQVQIQTNVNVTKITRSKPGFTLELQNGETLQANAVVLAGDCREIPPTPILASKASISDATTSSSKTTKKDFQDFDFDIDDDEPMSLKDQMKLEKKRQNDAKKKKMDQLVDAEEINVNELSKQDLRTLVKKRKKEAQSRKKKQKSKKAIETDSSEDDDEDADPEDQQPTDAFSFRGLDSVALAQTLGHTATKESLGCFSFMVPDRGTLEGCSKSIVPKARLRCKVEKPPQGRGGRLPKLESPLFLSQGEVSGPGAFRLSTLVAHEMAHSGNRGTLQIHFAPDVGSVEELEAALMEMADPAASVLKSPCPLYHREVDYDDYDIETGDFKSVEFPLVPKGLWGNLCRQAGITTAKLKWKDLPPNSLQSLARLLVDCPLTINGIRPQENVMAGGVSLKEVNMGECQSQLVEGLFLCGPTIDVHGFDGGFNPLAALATGYVAGTNAVAAVK